MPDNSISEFTDALRQLAARTTNLKPTLASIGQYQERQYQKAFDENRTPEGEAWKPLAASTLAQKRNPKMLVEGIGRIPASRFSEATNTSVAVGYGDPLAALHDEGFTIPARTIVPRDRQALYWIGAAHPVRRVNIPVTTVPARGLIGYSEADVREWREIILDDLAGDI